LEPRVEDFRREEEVFRGHPDPRQGAAAPWNPALKTLGEKKGGFGDTPNPVKGRLPLATPLRKKGQR